MKIVFETKDGTVMDGEIVKTYTAFEGDERVVVNACDGYQYRCTLTENGYKEI